ncbi:MAG: 1-deoxy-D-xylulose-5-phosphate synthase [Holosporales bacterium]|jgi:1-deoxy-D-xylulose-5-phosphate synthase|nr:1-deoxy-D-xylulose-5-phosphate synthase [Holosporales bacterium]
MILDSISTPSDIKKLSLAELEELCLDLRSEIIRITSKNGGHLGSNLGAVEIIVASHYVFDCEVDKFIFDVGHQAYAHKLLTGRRKLMEDLREETGASGFPDPSESKYDHFIAGHASTSLSAALGIAKARDLECKNFKIISILGDGSLSGGMIYEAINNAYGEKNFIAILNDNQMSISKTVGAMRKYLSKLLASKKGLLLRKSISKFLSLLPQKTSQRIEKFIKNIIASFSGHNIFEEFGFQYVGPIDGHNIKDLVKVFKNVRDVANYKPIIIHVITQKGKGYSAAELDSTNLHGIDNLKTKKYSDVFGSKIAELAAEDKKIVCITAAMKNGYGLTKFSEEFPDRFFDVGIAEEHAATFAAGLASQGFKPFVCIYSTFLQRCFDQIFHDVVLQNLPVKFIIDKAGFPGKDGKTHSGIYDVALLQNFPNFAIAAPSSVSELESAIKFANEYDKGPIAIRFPKAKAQYLECVDDFSMRSRVVMDGTKTLIVSCGDLLTNVLEAVETSKSSPTVIDARFVLPFDFDTFYKYSCKHDKIIFLEEGIWGGISSVILNELISKNQFDLISKIKFINANNEPARHASRKMQLRENGMSAEEIAKLF